MSTYIGKNGNRGLVNRGCIIFVGLGKRVNAVSHIFAKFRKYLQILAKQDYACLQIFAHMFNICGNYKPSVY